MNFFFDKIETKRNQKKKRKGETQNGVLALSWMDSKVVNFISSATPATPATGSD